MVSGEKMSQIVFHFERASKDFQFTVSYAEFNRSVCVKCEKNITKDALQLGVLEQVSYMITVYHNFAKKHSIFIHDIITVNDS